MSDLIIPPNMGGQLQPPIRDTLLEVLGDPTINKVFGGSDEKLSTAQAGLAAAVTVKMQERLIEQIRESHQRELRFIAGFWKLYHTPLLHLAPVSSPAASQGNTPEGPVAIGRFAGLFSWGNLLGGAAIVIVAISFYVTNLTKNYKDKWQDTLTEKNTLQGKYDAEVLANEGLEIELGKQQSRADSFEKSLNAVTGSSADLQQKMAQAISDLSAERGEVAKQVAASASEKKFQNLYESESKQLDKCQDRLAKCEDQLNKK
jgi:hypothetical protein